MLRDLQVRAVVDAWHFNREALPQGSASRHERSSDVSQVAGRCCPRANEFGTTGEQGPLIMRIAALSSGTTDPSKMSTSASTM
jgi:hypothetical protein